MRLLPDASKMVICTTGGYLMVIHDLDLETLPTDLYGFKVRDFVGADVHTLFF